MQRSVLPSARWHVPAIGVMRRVGSEALYVRAGADAQPASTTVRASSSFPLPVLRLAGEVEPDPLAFRHHPGPEVGARRAPLEDGDDQAGQDLPEGAHITAGAT